MAGRLAVFFARFPNPITRIQRVGVLSLASLVAGGIVLILFAQNVYIAPGALHAYDYRQGVFRVGSELSIQTWLAVLGVAFGMLSFGLSATYTHVFDWWCSWRARRAAGKGLEYARYLNSQPQAPVILGLYHGFPVAVLCRYLVAALAIAASVGYKFAVIHVKYGIQESLPVEQVRLRLPPVRGIENGTASPWLADGPLLAKNRAFFHTFAVWTLGGYEVGDAFRVPVNISMVGWANCSGLFSGQDHGVLVTREIIMVANMTEEGREVFMTSEQGNWARIETSSGGWIPGSSERAVVDYRIAEPGKVQIQWARSGNWKDDAAGTQRQQVERRLTYDMYYAVAEVVRLVNNGSCDYLGDEDGRAGPKIMSRSSSPIITRFSNGSVPLNQKFVEAILYGDEGAPREGVSAVIRGVTAGWAVQLAEMETADFRIGHAPPYSEPFGEEAVEDTWRQLAALGNFGVDYPYYDGYRTDRRTGSYMKAADAFFGLGILAIILAAARIAIGPPLLTSWMGQHVCLALVAGVGEQAGEDQLVTGYEVARRKHLGALKLVSSEGGTEVRLVRL